MAVDRLGELRNPGARTGVDAALWRIRKSISGDPLAAAAAAGILFGALAGGSAFFFAMTVVYLLGAHWSQADDD